jgi:uncharacterized protein VirK/YbjX
MSTTRYFSGEIPVQRTDFLETLRIIIGAVRYPAQTYRWLQFLKAHPLLAELTNSAPGLLSKIHKPYYSTRLGCSERVDLLMRHYEIVLGAGFSHHVRQALVRPITVASFVGKSNSAYRLELSAADSGNQAGELVLRLLSGDVCVYTISFIFTALNGKLHVNVGGLKGILATENNIGVKQITRDLYGCRPKDLMVSLAREIGGCLGCSTIILISNANKIPSAEKRACRKSSDYDQTWKEMNASISGNGDFELSCTHISSASENFPDTTRSMPTKRSALVDAARLALRNRLMGEQGPSIYKASVQSPKNVQ